jgi:hypothetical protein
MTLNHSEALSFPSCDAKYFSKYPNSSICYDSKIWLIFVKLLMVLGVELSRQKEYHPVSKSGNQSNFD